MAYGGSESRCVCCMHAHKLKEADKCQSSVHISSLFFNLRASWGSTIDRHRFISWGMHVRTSNICKSLTSAILDRPLRPAELLLEEKGEALRDGGKPCVAMPLKVACRVANTRELEFSSRTFTCHTINVHVRTHKQNADSITARHHTLAEALLQAALYKDHLSLQQR